MAHAPATDREWLSAPQAARLADVSVTSIYRMAKSGRLSTRHVPGSMKRYSRSDLVSLLAGAVQPATRSAAAQAEHQPAAQLVGSAV